MVGAAIWTTTTRWSEFWWANGCEHNDVTERRLRFNWFFLLSASLSEDCVTVSTHQLHPKRYLDRVWRRAATNENCLPEQWHNLPESGILTISTRLSATNTHTHDGWKRGGENPGGPITRVRFVLRRLVFAAYERTLNGLAYSRTGRGGGTVRIHQ